MQRYRLQSELQTKVEELQLTLDGALGAQLELELARATQRAAEVMRPFETFVEATHAAQCEREARLAASRAQLDELDRELQSLAALAQDGPAGDENVGNVAPR
jgi:hypothetical protein